MPDYSERPNSVPWPPILLAGSILGGLLLNRIVPLGWSNDTWNLWAIVGALTVVAALAGDVWAMRTFRAHQTTVSPIAAATHLATGGPFAWSRNPIYVGNVALIFGLGLYLGNGWMLLLAPLKALLVQHLAILPEEAHLAARFGAEWKKYCRKVRRWL